MRISKMIVTLLVSVVAVAAMTGVAVALPATVIITDNPIINPLDGSATTTTVTVSDIKWSLGDPQTRYISVKTSSANLQAKVTGTDADGNAVGTGWTTGAEAAGRMGDTWVARSSIATTYTYTVHVKGSVAGTVTVGDNYGNVFSDDSGADTASCTRDVDIPEFATIAIPAIAVLGLFLFFNKRKHKKD